ncbi:Hypothetical predicted protein [Lecanosticta acicola]|uniref:Tubby C-terminal-like domain-containing protein n=1 Tax=Lecanosticta acicola TaxID=111012 RepID=A0AAI8Z768_9PEZI|nr:Hypothetical predicted protein [Lecanosticta acicola]
MAELPEFAPAEPPLGPRPPDPAFYAPQQVTLQMREKVFSLSGDDFTVTTIQGMEVCKCKGKVMSLHGKKQFTDMQGNELFTVKKKTLALFKTFEGESPNGHNFTVKGHFSLGSSKSTIHFKNASDGQQIEMNIKGDWFDRKADITLNDKPVAHIARKFFNVREMFGDKQTYFVTVAANVDLSLIAAICVCLDERENDG